MIFLYHLEECVLCFLCPQARCCWVFGVVAEAPIQIQSQRSFGTKANSLRLHSLGSQMNGKDPHSPHHEDRTVPEWKSGPHSREATTANSFSRWYQIVDLNGKNFMLGYHNFSIGRVEEGYTNQFRFFWDDGSNAFLNSENPEMISSQFRTTLIDWMKNEYNRTNSSSLLLLLHTLYMFSSKILSGMRFVPL